MTPPYLVTSDAAEDIDAIYAYIARDNPGAADRVEEAIYDGCALLGLNPWLGSVRSDLTELNLRF
jgi:plasmid stabilization system protein ParE